MERQFTVTGVQTAYATKPGGTVSLDASDPLVRMNIAAGVLVLVDGQPDPKYPCPACAESGMKRPPSFATSDLLADHYGEKHPALVAPEWEEEA